MLNAFKARKDSIECQLKLVLDFIDTAIKSGYKDINVSEELDEDILYDEVISVLTKNGFDVIVKKYSDRFDTWISWENGKKENGNLVFLNCTLKETEDKEEEEESNDTFLFFC